MDTIDLTIIRNQIVQASAAGIQERSRRQAEYEKHRAEQFEREKPEHLARAKKILEELPGRVEEAKLYNYAKREFCVMKVLTDDYDYDNIPPDERCLPLREVHEYIRRHEWYNDKPYLVMSKHLKLHSAAALVLRACEQLGLNPHLNTSGISGPRDAGAEIDCYCS
jgi:hypothetical protein